MPTPVSLGATGAAASASSIALTGGVAIQSGDGVLIAVGWDGAASISSASDGTNTYAVAVASGSTNTFHAAILYKANCTAVANPTITVNFSAAVPFREIAAVRCTNIATTTPLDKTNSVETTSAAPSITTGVLAQASEIVFGAIYANNSGGTPTVTEPTGFTRVVADSTAGTPIDFSSNTVSSTASVTYNPTLSTSEGLAAAVATFKLVPQAYSLALGVGSFNLTGVNSRVGRVLSLSLGVGSFALTGLGMAFSKPYRLALGVGSFVLTGLPELVTSYAAPASKFAIRGADFVLQQLRRTPPESVQTATTNLFRLLGGSYVVTVSSLSFTSAPPAWNSGTDYGASVFAVLGSDNLVYTATGTHTSNLNHDPTTDNGTYWKKVGPMTLDFMSNNSVLFSFTATGSQSVSLPAGQYQFRVNWGAVFSASVASNPSGAGYPAPPSLSQ